MEYGTAQPLQQPFQLPAQALVMGVCAHGRHKHDIRLLHSGHTEAADNNTAHVSCDAIKLLLRFAPAAGHEIHLGAHDQEPHVQQRARGYSAQPVPAR